MKSNRYNSLAYAWYFAMLLSFANLGHADGRTEELHWYRGNMHTHTRAPDFPSDANETPDFVAHWYRDHGYQFLVITDHEHLTDVAPLNEKYAHDGLFLVIPGQEITQAVADSTHPAGERQAHVNGINLHRLITPVLLQGQTMSQAYERNVTAIETAGAIPQINHPNLDWSVRLTDLLPLAGPYLLEIWNGYPFSNNLGGADQTGHESPSAEGLWDQLLTRGKTVWGVGGDDAHTYHQFDDSQFPNPGRAWVVVHAPELKTEAIVAALKRGQFYASTGISLSDYSTSPSGIEIKIAPAEDHFAELKARPRFATRFIGEGGRVLLETHGAVVRYKFKGTEKYVRASIIDSDGRRAWTEPVFRDFRQRLTHPDE